MKQTKIMYGMSVCVCVCVCMTRGKVKLSLHLSEKKIANTNKKKFSAPIIRAENVFFSIYENKNRDALRFNHHHFHHQDDDDDDSGDAIFA